MLMVFYIAGCTFYPPVYFSVNAVEIKILHVHIDHVVVFFRSTFTNVEELDTPFEQL